MTTLLLNETLVKFPLLSDGSEKQLVFDFVSKLASVYQTKRDLSFSVSHNIHLPISLWLAVFFSLTPRAHFYYYRESQTIHFIYTHTFSISHISCTRQESKIRHFTLVSLTLSLYRSVLVALRCSLLFSCALRREKASIKNLNTTEFQAFRIVKIFQWVIQFTCRFYCIVFIFK